MITSESIDQVAAAYVAASSKFEAVVKDSDNPFFNSKFADLNSLLKMVRPIFAEHGLSILQPSVPSTHGVCIQTVVLHESGQYLASEGMLMPASKEDPQGYGAASTYDRRFDLQSMLGITAEDDDGNTASAGMSKAEQARAAARERAQKSRG